MCKGFDYSSWRRPFPLWWNEEWCDQSLTSKSGATHCHQRVFLQQSFLHRMLQALHFTLHPLQISADHWNQKYQYHSVSFSININNANIWASTSTAKRGHTRSCWLCLSTKQNIKHHAASQIDLQMAASPSLLSPIKKINGSGIPNAPGKVLKKFHYLGQTLSEQEPAMY